MDSVAVSAGNPFSSPLSIFSPKKSIACKRPHLLAVSSKGNDDEADLHSKSEDTSLVPFLKNPSSLSRLSKDAAMDLVLSAVVGTGWTTGSGMEGPSDSSTDRTVSTFPWSLFTKSPRRRMLVAFTCKVCGQRTTRAINPHAYTDGTVFVQCCGCFVFHKLVDNLNLFQDMKCYVGSSFQYKEDGSFEDNDDGNIFPIL